MQTNRVAFAHPLLKSSHFDRRVLYAIFAPEALVPRIPVNCVDILDMVNRDTSGRSPPPPRRAGSRYSSTAQAHPVSASRAGLPAPS